MSDSHTIVERAKQMIAMLVDDDQKARIMRKALPLEAGVVPSLMDLAMALARHESKVGARTAKAALPKALITVAKKA